MSKTLATSLRLRDQFSSTLSNINNGLKNTMSSMDNFKKSLENQTKGFDKMKSSSSESINQTVQTVKKGSAQAVEAVNSMKQNLENIDPAKGLANKTKQSMEESNSSVKNGVNQIKNTMNTMNNVASISRNPFAQLSAKAQESMNQVQSKIKSGFDRVASIAESGKSKIIASFSNFGNGISSKVSSAFNKVSNTAAFQKISNAAKSMGQSIKQSFSNAKSSGDNFGNSMENVGNRVSSSFKSILGAIGVTKVIGTAVSAVKSSFGGAIDRFDTMQKFPKVTSALGFSANDSSKSINKLSDGIDGLPTTLQDVVARTQQFTSITGDLNKSTDTVLGLNSAFLASGATLDGVDRGMQQYQQMMSTGVVDLESWKTLQETMPLALQKTAEAMGFTGKTAQRDLYSALKEGNVTFDQFQDKLIELGTGTGMLNKLAKENSLGIRTSFGNLKNAISKGLANMTTKADELTKKFTGKTIAQNIDGLKASINSAFGAIVNNMDKAVPYIQKAADFFKPLVNSIKSLDGGKILKGFADSFVETGQQLQSFMRAVSPVVNFLKNTLVGALKSLGGGDLEAGLGKLPMTILKTVLAYKALSKVMKILPAIKLPKLPFFGSKGKAPVNPLASYAEMFKGFTKNTLNLASVYMTLKVIEEAAQAMQDVSQKVPSNFADLGSKLIAMGVAMAGMTIGIQTIGKYVSKSPASMIAGILGVVATAGTLVLAAKALQSVDKAIPATFNTTEKKLLLLSKAILGTTAAAAVVGTAMLASGGLGALATGVGLASFLAVAGTLTLISKSIAVMNATIPANPTSITKKINTLATIMQSFNQLSIGNPFTAISNLGKSINISAVNGAIKKLISLGITLNVLDSVKIPRNPDKLIQGLVKVVKSISDSDMGRWLSAIANVGRGLNISSVTNVVNKLRDLATSLTSLETVQFSNSKVESNIQGISSALATVKKNVGPLGSFLSAFQGIGVSLNLDSLEKVRGKVQDIGTKLKFFENFNFSNVKVESSIEGISSALQSIKDNVGPLGSYLSAFQGIGTMMNLDALEIVRGKVEKLGTKLKFFETLQFSNIKVEGSIQGIASALQTIKDSIGPLGSYLSAFQGIGTMLNLDALEIVRGKVKSIGQKLIDFESMTFSGIKIESNIQAIGSALRSIKNNIGPLGSFLEAFQGIGVMLNLDSLEIVRSKVTAIGNKLRDFETLTFSGISVQGNIQAIAKTLQEIKNDIGPLGSFLEAFQGLGVMLNLDALEIVRSKVASLGSKIKDFEKITFSGITVNGNIQAIAETLQTLKNEIGPLGSYLSAFQGMGVNLNIDQLADVSSKIQVLGNALKGFESLTFSGIAVNSNIHSIAETLGNLQSEIGGLGSYLDAIQGAGVSLNVDKLSEVSVKVRSVGNILQTFENLSFSGIAVNGNIHAIAESLGVLQKDIGRLGGYLDAFKGLGVSLNVDQLSDVASKVNRLGTILKGFEGLTFSGIAVSGNIHAIADALSQIQKDIGGLGSYLEAFQGMGVNLNLDAFSDVVNKVSRLGTILKGFEGITFSTITVKGNIESISESLRALSVANFGEITDLVTGADIEPAAQAVEAIKKVGNSLLSLMEVTPPAAIEVQGRISGVKLAMQALSELDGIFDTIPQSGSIETASQSLQSVANLVPQINAIANATPQADAAIAAIKKIQEVLNTINTLNAAELPASIGGFSSLAGSMNQVSGAANGLVTSLSGIGSSYSNMQTTVSGANTTMLTSTQTTFTGMNTAMASTMAQIVATINSGTAQMASAFANGMAQSAAAVNNGKAAIIGAMSGLNGQLYSAGVFAMQGLTNGINAGASSAVAAARSVANQVSAAVKSAMDIHSPSRVMAKLGGFITQGLAVGMINDLREVDRASNQLAQAIQVSGANDLGFTSENSLTVDDSEISKIKAASTQQVIVNNKQLTPQVVINIENKDGEPIDTDSLLQEFEDKIIELMESDLG